MLLVIFFFFPQVACILIIKLKITTDEAVADEHLEILDAHHFTRPLFVSAFEVFIPNLL